nr:hypothetical protein Itr_chr05CG22930 [Ipomoea trifida]
MVFFEVVFVDGYIGGADFSADAFFHLLHNLPGVKAGASDILIHLPESLSGLSSATPRRSFPGRKLIEFLADVLFVDLEREAVVMVHVGLPSQRYSWRFRQRNGAAGAGNICVVKNVEAPGTAILVEQEVQTHESRHEIRRLGPSRRAAAFRREIV